MMEQDQIEIVKRFAASLDEEDYGTARAVLSAECVYVFRGETYEGPEAIVATYEGNGDAAKAFDEISYGSSVRAGEDGWVVIEFWDELVHRGERLRHVCEQWARVENGSIVRIEHHDLEGERERLEAFKIRVGVGDRV
jgi:ketosteroid isomerase-like protein